MPNFGPPELLIILLIVILLFGAGRIAKIGGEMGSAISNFRQGINPTPDSNPEAGEQNTDKSA